MTLQRPLVKRVDGDWHMNILEMPGMRGFMFQWTFGDERSGMSQGFPHGLTAWPVLGYMLLNIGNGARLLESESVKEVLAEIDRLGWGEPPHIDEVFKDAREAFMLLGGVLTSHSLKKSDTDAVFEETLGELRQKWQALIDTTL